jgi:hypothetical protein
VAPLVPPVVAVCAAVVAVPGATGVAGVAVVSFPGAVGKGAFVGAGGTPVDGVTFAGTTA